MFFIAMGKKQEKESLNDETGETVKVIFDECDDDDDYPSFTAQVVINKERLTKEASSCYCAELSLAGDRETQEWKVELENDLPEVHSTTGEL